MCVAYRVSSYLVVCVLSAGTKQGELTISSCGSGGRVWVGSSASQQRPGSPHKLSAFFTVFWPSIVRFAASRICTMGHIWRSRNCCLLLQILCPTAAAKYVCTRIFMTARLRFPYFPCMQPSFCCAATLATKYALTPPSCAHCSRHNVGHRELPRVGQWHW